MKESVLLFYLIPGRETGIQRLKQKSTEKYSRQAGSCDCFRPDLIFMLFQNSKRFVKLFTGEESSSDPAREGGNTFSPAKVFHGCTGPEYILDQSVFLDTVNFREEVPEPDDIAGFRKIIPQGIVQQP